MYVCIHTRYVQVHTRMHIYIYIHVRVRAFLLCREMHFGHSLYGGNPHRHSGRRGDGIPDLASLDELCSRAAAAAEPFVPLQRACPRECRCGRPFGFVCVSRSVWLVVCVRVLVCVHACKQA